MKNTIRYDYMPASPTLLAKWHYNMKDALAKANRTMREIDRCWTSSALWYRLPDLYESLQQQDQIIQRFNAMIQAELAMRTMYPEGD